MASTYFTSLTDINLAKEVLAKMPDLYIQKREYGGTGTYLSDTGGAGGIEVSTDPSWTTNEYASTVADNILFLDDNNKVATGKITGNSNDTIFFDPTACVLEEDGTTAPTVTTATEYQFRVYSPSSVAGATEGPFFGYVEGAELAITDTFMKFKYSKPKQMKFKDLEEREGQITGGNVNFTNEDVIKTMFGAVQYGSQVGQYSYAVGSNPDTDLFYRLTFNGEDRTNRVVKIRLREVQFEITGNIFQSAEACKKVVELKNKTQRFVSEYAQFIRVKQKNIFAFKNKASVIRFLQSAKDMKKRGFSYSRFTSYRY